MNDLEPVIDSARADFAGARTPAELEDAKARYLGKSGHRHRAAEGARRACRPSEKKARGAEINAAKQAIEAALVARRAELAERAAREPARGAGARRHAARPQPRHRRHPSGEPRARADRGDLRLARLRGRRRPRDRDRLVQLHRAQQPGEPSGAVDAGHLLRRPQGRRRPLAQPAAAHLADADPPRAGAREAARRRRDDARRARDRARAAPIASTATPRTRRCSTRSRASGSARTSAFAT